ncbi:MAG: restriction endonuclease subunit S [Anaerolineae bacterium]
MTLPEGWREARLGEFIQSCKNGYGRRPDGHEAGPIVLRLADVSHGFIDLSNPRTVAMERSEIEAYDLRADDLLVVRVNGSRDMVARCIYVDRGYEDVVFNDHLMRVRLGSNLDARYAAMMLGEPRTRAWLLGFVPPTEGGQLTINQQSLASLRVILPPLPEQHKIAEILGTWDKAIALVEQRLAAARVRKQGLMQRLLTGQVRFPGFVRSTEQHRGKFFDIPADWTWVAIGDISRQVSRKNGANLSLPVLSCTKYDGLVDSLAYFGRRVFSDDTSTYKIVRRGEFAYATNHIEEGSIGLQELYDAALISPMYTVFGLKGGMDAHYLYALVKTELYRHIFEVNTSGTVNRRGALRWNDFGLIPVPMPSLAEQRKIAEVLREQDEETATVAAKLAALQAQKRGLMQRLLTGEVRVRGE